MMPWWTRVERVLEMVISWPPPGDAVDTNALANLPARAPLAQSAPVVSQKA